MAGEPELEAEADLVLEDEPEVAAAVACPDPETWMECMFPAGLLPVTEITMPGSHDAATYAITSDQIYARGCGSVPDWIPGGISGKWARTQSGDLGAQAENGSRYFDIRVYFRGDGSLSTCHSLEGATFADSMGKGSSFQQFVRSHPNEIFILDMQQFFAENGTKDSPNRKKQFATWLKDEFGDILVTRSEGARLADLSLAEMRAAGRNVIILGKDSMIIDDTMWPRSENLYSEWNDVSTPAITFWDQPLGGGQEKWPLDLAKRELDVLGRAPDDGSTLNVLNYITDTNCPDGTIGKTGCYSAYVFWAGTVSNYKQWVFPRIPSMARQVARTGKPAVVMRDVTSEGSNAPIWNINTRENG